MATLLNRSATTFLDVTGAGRVVLQPDRGEVWKIDTAYVRASSNVNEATCNLYVGADTSSLNYRGGTFSGSSGDTSSAVGGPVKIPDKVFAVWSGGDAGALVTLNITGTQGD